MATASTYGQGKNCVYHYARTSSTAHPASFPKDEVSGVSCRVQKCLELYFYSTIRLHDLDIPSPLLHNTSALTGTFSELLSTLKITKRDLKNRTFEVLTVVSMVMPFSGKCVLRPLVNTSDGSSTFIQAL